MCQTRRRQHRGFEVVGRGQRRVATFARHRNPALPMPHQACHPESGAGADHRQRAAGHGLATTEGPQLLRRKTRQRQRQRFEVIQDQQRGQRQPLLNFGA